MTVTKQQLREVMPRLSESEASMYIGPLNGAMESFQINTPARVAAFLAQVAHESGELKYFEEIWGPTPAQKRYEGRKDLGNTKPGDGYKYRGRGPIQLTGRANYRKAGKAIGIDLENDPDQASLPNAGFCIAAWFWDSRKLNTFADEGTEEAFKAITKKINGGYNGLAERQEYWERAKKALIKVSVA